MITQVYDTMKEMFNAEVRDLKRLNENPPFWFNLKEAKVKALDRGYGVQEFAQRLGISFEIADKYYTKFREEVEAIGVDN